ncbi:hypothetical protein ACOMHN_064338 [Nucella lapillus]
MFKKRVQTVKNVRENGVGLPVPTKTELVLCGSFPSLDVKMASQGQQPAMPESVWMPFVGDAFPNLERQTYFVPPLHFNHVPFYPAEVVPGQTVQVLDYPPQQAKKRRPKKAPPAESDPQVAGVVFTGNPAGLKQARVVTTDTQDDYAHGYTLECLRVMAERNQEVMMVVSQLRFKKYLDKKTNPVHVAMAALLPNPLSLPTQIQDGECDVLILHPRYGLVVGEVKSVGSGPYFLDAPPAEQDQIIREKVRRGVEQLNNQSTILTHLVSDLGVRVTLTLILPNVTAARLRQVLSADAVLTQDLIQCLGGGDLPSTLTKCLCKDSMPEPQLLQLLGSAPLEVSSRWTLVRHAVRNNFRSLQDRLQATSGAASNSPSSSSLSSVSSERCLVSLCGWWKERVVKRGRDPAMSPDVYRRLVARFCGPATTIEIPTPSRPAKEIRTHGQAVAEAGLRISRLALYPSQVDLLNCFLLLDLLNCFLQVDLLNCFLQVDLLNCFLQVDLLNCFLQVDLLNCFLQVDLLNCFLQVDLLNCFLQVDLLNCFLQVDLLNCFLQVDLLNCFLQVDLLNCFLQVDLLNCFLQVDLLNCFSQVDLLNCFLQVDLLNSTFSRAQCVYLQGPPGTGKTVTLVLKALQWLNQGRHVWLLSIWPPARAITSVIHCQILASLTPPGAGGGGGGTAASSVGVPNLLCRYYDLKNKPEEADDVVKDLTKAAADCDGDLNVIIDEVELVNKKHRDLLKEIVDAIPTASLWAAGLYTLPTFPPWLHPEPLTHPLRCPPTVHRQVRYGMLK